MSVSARVGIDRGEIGANVRMLCAIVSLVLAVASYAYGRQHGFDRWMPPETIEYDNVKLAAALPIFTTACIGGARRQACLRCVAAERIFDLPCDPGTPGGKIS